MTDTTTPTPPSIGDLLKGAPPKWGRWGDTDEVGALNHLGREEAVAAAHGVRSGKVGVPDEYRGETVKAFVRLVSNGSISAEELVAHCKERMATDKYPRTVEIIEELPKTVTGKILRRELRSTQP